MIIDITGVILTPGEEGKNCLEEMVNTMTITEN